MEAAFRAAWAIFGPIVASWTVGQLRAWAAEQMPDDAHLQGNWCEDTPWGKARDCGMAMRCALNADPDDGVYFWEFQPSQQ